MTNVAEEKDEDFGRQRFWSDFHAAYAALRADPDAWAAYQREGEVWDLTLADGPEIGPDEDQDGDRPPHTRD